MRNRRLPSLTNSRPCSQVAILELDDTICYCFHVSQRKIRNFIRIHKPRRASQISECGGAGTGCGWCVSYLKRYFEDAAAGSPTDNDRLTPAEYAQQRAAYIRAGHGVPAAGAIPLPANPLSESGPRDASTQSVNTAHLPRKTTTESP